MNPFLLFFQNLLPKDDMQDYKLTSRKYKLTLLIFTISTLIFVLPPVISALVLKIPTLVILSGSEWISVITLVSGFYFGANVAQKKITPFSNQNKPEDQKE